MIPVNIIVIINSPEQIVKEIANKISLFHPQIRNEKPSPSPLALFKRKGEFVGCGSKLQNHI
jgi:hypothetical protein